MLVTTALITLALAGGTQNAASGVQIVDDVDGVRGGKVKVGVNIDNAKSTAVRKAREGVVSSVVRTLVAEGAEKPMKVRGYDCTPTVSGHHATRLQWECEFEGGRPKTTVELDFGYRLQG